MNISQDRFERLKPGMLAQTKSKSYMPEYLGPFAIKIHNVDDLGGYIYNSLRPMKIGDVVLIVKITERNEAIILLGEELFVINVTFLKPL
ncbi:MAG: hypothetical protein WC761_01915 [Candidatus Paceibacterota bacterium]|jgi:hypothetical protein